MSTAAQLVANRANSQLSTGPRTPEGKAASSRNATRHGFTAMRLIVAPEDQAEFESFQLELLADVRPEGAIEKSLFDRLLLAHWNLRRVTLYETELLDQTNPFAPGNPESAQAFDRLARYRRDLDRSAKLTLAELRKLQTERAILLQQQESAAASLYTTTPLAELSRLTGETDRIIRQSLQQHFVDPLHKDRHSTIAAAQEREQKIKAILAARSQAA